MAKVKALIKRHEVEMALRKRKCTHSGMPIPKGQLCLVVYDGPRDRHPYSREIALKMIDQARDTLDQLQGALTANEQSP